MQSLKMMTWTTFLKGRYMMPIDAIVEIMAVIIEIIAVVIITAPLRRL